MQQPGRAQRRGGGIAENRKVKLPRAGLAQYRFDDDKRIGRRHIGQLAGQRDNFATPFAPWP